MIEYFIPIGLAVFVILIKALDYEGAFVATAFSYIILARHDIHWLYVILVFFVVGSLATWFKLKYKRKFTSKTRGASNVIANGVIAILMAIIGQFYGFIGAIAAACGDTLSSEIGMLSNKTPIMITTFKKTEKGKNGGITLLGTLASAVGGLLVGLAAWFIAPYPYTVLVCVICGVFGSLFDSYIGAVFENSKYMGNSGVNLMATIFGALIGIILFVMW